VSGNATYTPKVVIADIGFPEALRWHQNQLWYSDFLSRTVSTFDAKKRTVRAYIPGQPSGLGFQPDGVPWVISTYDRKVLALDSPIPRIVADIGHLSGGPLNDMYVDPANGFAYVSPFGWENAYRSIDEMRSAPLIVVRPDAEAEVVAEDLMIPNGIARLDTSTLLVAETHANRITAFDIEPDGRLANRRVFAELGARAPDGICVDAEGCVWVGCPFTGEFIRVRAGGEVVDVIDMSLGWAVCPVLGGDDGRTLFLATAETDMDGFYAGRSRGSISAVQVDVPARAEGIR